ncbi:MAG: bifunctional enoyl-CoA hydratase/phosphate acetyltransferase [Acidobacteria bacterium]|nr:bifunctional enoyl-CoA hydratase/phosphate acetyltransferase [Acidobacteriota bacterium]
MKTLNELIKQAASVPPRKIAVAMAGDGPVLEAIAEAMKLGIVKPILYGDRPRIETLAEELGISLSGCTLIQSQTPEDCARMAVSAVSHGKADIVMKGLVSTDVFLRAILNKEWGLRTASVLSHVALFEIPAYHKLILLTDAAMNIAPDLQQKVHITRNAVRFMEKVTDGAPKIAFLAHSEKIMAGNPASADAALLSAMAKRGQLGNVIADGPLALDGAISAEAAAHKGIESTVTGDADILVCPGIQSGNALYKSLTYFAKARTAALIAGAKAPIVLTSRADSPENKLLSIVFAVVNA